ASRPIGRRTAHSYGYTARLSRHPHHDAYATNSPLVPRSDDKRKGFPSARGSSSSGTLADASARPPDSGPSAHSPLFASCTSALEVRSAKTRTSTRAFTAAWGSLRSPRQSTSGLLVQPYRRSKVYRSTECV